MTTTPPDHRPTAPVLVTGATGTVGRHVVDLLRRRGVPVRAFVRDRRRAVAVLGTDVDLAVGDLGDRASLDAAVSGTRQVFLACVNDPRQVAWETAAIDAAVDAGVRRVVKLSARGARTASPVAFGDAHGRVEEHLRGRGIAHVVLRPGFYLTNLLGAADAVRQGILPLPAGAARIAVIDPRDVAEVAVAVLAGADHDGRTYELTGPAAVTGDDVARELTALLGRRVDYVPVTDEVATAGLLAAGVPAWSARGTVAVFGELRRGAQSEASDVVRVVTGREPRSLADFLADHVAAFRTGDDALATTAGR
ncbi:NmrA family NAD(P)-binding protein [Actinomycetospora straminea]|uniref:SDR family oxidoreductase n=1 Tax=Actinomycetospora straminea TaxID=663607 RepID=A0ABP9EI33_9PSEU|nr:NmrA family NAD(P)-binding protein [Actinomycetospora straminea]MDD7935674.1 NmrA family NAD(P)-binding protein [Actinomycetospora straminea]